MMIPLPLSFLRNVLAILFVVALALSAYIAAWLLVDVRAYIDVRTVVIPDHEVGEDPEILISRDLNRGFSGQYVVSIREQPSNLLHYTTGPVEIEYRTPQEPISGRTLSWWAYDGGGGMAPLPVGTYSVETCHFVRPWYLLHSKARCVVSDTFRVTEDAP